jgi:hypothetical protein
MRREEITAKIQERFQEYRRLNRNSGFSMLPILVHTFASSWELAMKNFEAFHESENSELHKAAAFLVYWFSKVKPILIAPGHLTTNQITINESFALMLSLFLLGIDPKRISQTLKLEFIYSLYYRDVSPRQMFHTFELLDRLNKEIPVEQRMVLI